MQKVHVVSEKEYSLIVNIEIVNNDVIFGRRVMRLATPHCHFPWKADIPFRLVDYLAASPATVIHSYLITNHLNNARTEEEDP